MTENSGFKKDLKFKLHLPNDECLQPVFKIQVKDNSVKCNADQSQL